MSICCMVPHTQFFLHLTSPSSLRPYKEVVRQRGKEGGDVGMGLWATTEAATCKLYYSPFSSSA